ncbi:SH3 and multiple ankyrin repeat domains protein 3-like [Delphinapterus leucas]|uniref:SH3 and multiple ankyrin repeat domains protein 3-like n=1 Tax=Delphinapterus leucas TaxID=9749 RepID=A0A2Y9P7H4_DELLE|nr:SH3 and multiple ankyrin repeat domains protein 3-like [Delphinapterus leucas]
MLGEGGDLDSTNSTLIMKTWVGLAQGSSNPAWIPAFLPKRPRPKEPFAFGGGLEGKEGRGREQAGVCKPAARRGELGAPALGRRVRAGDAVALSGPESGDAPSPPLTPPAPPGSAPESLRPGGSDFRRRGGLWGLPGPGRVWSAEAIAGAGGAGQGQGKRDPKPDRRFPSLPLSPAPAAPQSLPKLPVSGRTDCLPRLTLLPTLSEI